MDELVKELDDLRAKLGITKRELCRRIGIAESTLHQWIRGAWKDIKPSIRDHLKRIIEEMKKEAMSLQDKLQDELELEFDHLRVFGEPEDPSNVYGALCRKVTLFKLKDVLKTDEDAIIKAIEKLVKSGRLRLVDIPRQKDLNIHNLKFWFQLGFGDRTVFTGADIVENCSLTNGRVIVRRLFRKTPLQPDERDSQEIMNVRETVDELRSELQANLDQRIIKPASGWHVERKLRAEAREDETALKNAALKSGKKE